MVLTAVDGPSRLTVSVVVDGDEGDKVVVGAVAAAVVIVAGKVSVLTGVGLITGPVSSVHYALKVCKKKFKPSSFEPFFVCNISNALRNTSNVRVQVFFAIFDKYDKDFSDRICVIFQSSYIGCKDENRLNK